MPICLALALSIRKMPFVRLNMRNIRGYPGHKTSILSICMLKMCMHKTVYITKGACLVLPA